MKITCFEDLAAEAKRMAKKTVIAVVEAQDEHTLESVIQATKDGIMVPALIGNEARIRALLARFGADPGGFDIVPANGAEDSLQKAVALIKAGKAGAIMKGILESGQFMKAILDKENGLIPAGGKLSLIGFYEAPKYHKLFAVSDFGLNTYPDLALKRIIIENAVRLLHALGHESPKVAVLSSVEKVNPKMPDAVDGGALKEMNQRGELSGCIVEGPISFDLATSAEAARIKGYLSPVAGDADLLIVPDIAAGNMLVKCLTGFGGARTAGTVLGAAVPVILTSRSAEASDKYYSIALAACAAAGF
ncbi:Phosphate acetyl/butaryl transferase [Sporobacter termitidis DSM 10068]|uniref:Phosphate acetyl/butaryl transferase n=1 Tax=Sporobacter termitidis DSM 10068 TaxID=1123282 RepID=A0A1M5U7W5_9FIRM|nr:bifunctional enoyl-CoA hydratase/phosphate acetyltransferase [Sporobacter termitidis]SHH59001.1 Phosphate acetyl/butaryl transferase [Sporobacter termitidis DSM 10068]